jgi:hypothetical protein
MAFGAAFSMMEAAPISPPQGMDLYVLHVGARKDTDKNYRSMKGC